MFYSFDGIDGTGKSTQLNLFCDWLRRQGSTVVQCRDPGTTALGEQLRALVVEGSKLRIAQRAETLIYMAARAQLVDEVIQPALREGHVVVSDRFLLANVVYQAYGLELDAADVWSVGTFATAGVIPDLTFVLDLDVDTAVARLNRPADRMERRGRDYFQRVREGFLAEAAQHPEQIVVIDADNTVENVHAAICRAAEQSDS